MTNQCVVGQTQVRERRQESGPRLVTTDGDLVVETSANGRFGVGHLFSISPVGVRFCCGLEWLARTAVVAACRSTLLQGSPHQESQGGREQREASGYF